MSWQAFSEPQRLTPCGYAGMSIVGRPVHPTAGDKPSLGRRLT